MKDPETSWGAPLKPVYGPGDLAADQSAERLRGPGEFPFTRGVRREMYRKRL